MTRTIILLAIALAITYGRYWALTDRLVWLSRIRLNKRSARAVKAVRSRRRVVPVMTGLAGAEDEPTRPSIASRAVGREAAQATRRAEP